jgi:16S rRNA (guanine966-N2)-methyltransferase
MGVIIMGGKYRGRKLATVTRSGLVRPTSGKVREALFSSLGDRVADASFVDLFSGSGAVGLEALSRGAREVHLVENHPQSWDLLRANCLTVLSEKSDATVTFPIRSDAWAFCNRCREIGKTFDMVFADPPFQSDFSGLWEAIRGILSPGAVAVIQFPSRTSPAWLVAAEKVKQYGESSLAFLKIG